MPFYTPLRYPGGKRQLAPAIVRLLESNGLRNVTYAEPCAGGAAVALTLLLEEHATTVHINDLSRAVYAIWHTILYETTDLCQRIARTRVSMREWEKQREVYRSQESAELAELGFAALFLNRTNRSGIIGGGVIGGRNQSGKWTLDVRYNKDELVRRIRRIARYGNRINVHNLDALEFSERVLPTTRSPTFVFYDPPYIEKGGKLYLNEYDIAGHRELATYVSALEHPWVVTYDEAAVRLGLYKSQRRLAYGLKYRAQTRQPGREVMFLADELTVPDDWLEQRSILLSRDGNRYEVCGTVEDAD